MRLLQPAHGFDWFSLGTHRFRLATSRVPVTSCPHMTPAPWWAEEARAVISLGDVPSQSLGILWCQAQRISRLRENTSSELLLLDFQAQPLLKALWRDLETHSDGVTHALAIRRSEVTHQLHSHQWSSLRFREEWESMEAESADAFLDGLWGIDRLTLGEERPAFAQVNMASRSARISDFLEVVEPSANDLIFDLGSGNGKVALTIAASTSARVVGVELGESYVRFANNTAQTCGLGNAEFVHQDVCDVSLSEGTAFYLFHPFYGEVAACVADKLAVVARKKSVVVYLQGPSFGFGEYFSRHVDDGAFREEVRQGPCSDLRVLRSAI
jgi:predicted RNA methylase